jgi:hypothetical protein
MRGEAVIKDEFMAWITGHMIEKRHEWTDALSRIVSELILFVKNRCLFPLLG